MAVPTVITHVSVQLVRVMGTQADEFVSSSTDLPPYAI